MLRDEAGLQVEAGCGIRITVNVTDRVVDIVVFAPRRGWVGKEGRIGALTHAADQQIVDDAWCRGWGQR